MEECHDSTIHRGRPFWSDAQLLPVPAMPCTPGGFVTLSTTSYPVDRLAPAAQYVGSTATPESAVQSKAHARLISR